MYRIVGTAIPALCTLLFAVGCSSEKPEAGKQPEAERHAADERRDEQDMRLSDLADQFKRVESYARRYPRQLENVLAQINDFKTDAAGTKFEKDADTLAARARERFAEDARFSYEKARGEADALIKAGKFREALAALGGYPAEFSSTEWQPKIDEMARTVEREADADIKLESLKEAVKARMEGRDPETALRLLEGYPEEMRKGERGTQWEKMRSEVSAGLQAAREQRSKEDALPWDELFSGASMDRWSPMSGEWSLKDGCIVGKYAGGAAGFIYSGTGDLPWDNLVVELEFKITSGEYLVLGIRGKNEAGRSVFEQVVFAAIDFTPGKFHAVTVEARGNVITVTEKTAGTVSTQNAEPGFTRGPICFFIPSGAEVHIRKVRLKHLSPSSTVPWFLKKGNRSGG